MRIIGLVIAAVLGLAHGAAAQQLQTCQDQTDVYTVPITGSATLQTATFNFNDLTGRIVFKTTPFRLFTSTNINQIQTFTTTKTPDSYFSTFSTSHHESLLAQTPSQGCPLLNENGAFLLTH